MNDSFWIDNILDILLMNDSIWIDNDLIILFYFQNKNKYLIYIKTNFTYKKKFKIKINKLLFKLLILSKKNN